MAYAISMTIGTGNKVSMNYQSQDVSVSLTYQLERDDTDILALVERKAAEVEKAHRTAWKRIRDERLAEQGASHAANKANGANGANGVGTDEPASNGSKSNPNGQAEAAEPAKAGPASLDEPGKPEQAVPAPVAQLAKTESRNGVSPQHRGQTQTAGVPSQRPITTTQLGAIRSLAARLGLTDEELSRRTDIRCGKKSLEELTELQGTSLILELQRNAPVIAGNRIAVAPEQASGSGEAPPQEEPQGGNGHGKRTRRATARS